MSKKHQHNDDEKDVVIEPEADMDVFPDEEEVSATEASKIKKLKKELAQVKEEKLQVLTDLQKAKADFINMRKRDEEGNREFVKYAKEGVIADIIPVLDSFDMAFSNKESWESVSKEWRTGVEYIYNQLLSVLTNNGVSEVNPAGEEFNPSIHEALEMVETDNKKDDHKILSVVQKGYKMGDKVIRPAKVKVANYTEQSADKK